MNFILDIAKRIITPPYLWALSVLLFLLLVIVMYFSLRSMAFASASETIFPVVLNEDNISSQKFLLEKNIEETESKVLGLVPKKSYIVINTAANEFALYNDRQLIKKDKCSTGSYILLKNDKNQQWMFKTPKGEFNIRNKTKQPVWKKPDWAFIEEGLPVPSMNHPSRYEYGVLGDYSLALGDGYLIHGTLYQRFLGLPVTHGCIRLNDENLKLVFQQMNTGDKVFIF